VYGSNSCDAQSSFYGPVVKKTPGERHGSRREACCFKARDLYPLIIFSLCLHTTPQRQALPIFGVILKTHQSETSARRQQRKTMGKMETEMVHVQNTCHIASKRTAPPPTARPYSPSPAQNNFPFKPLEFRRPQPSERVVIPSQGLGFDTNKTGHCSIGGDGGPFRCPLREDRAAAGIKAARIRADIGKRTQNHPPYSQLQFRLFGSMFSVGM